MLYSILAREMHTTLHTLFRRCIPNLLVRLKAHAYTAHITFLTQETILLTKICIMSKHGSPLYLLQNVQVR